MRAKAIAIAVASSSREVSRAAQQQREERIVGSLEGEASVVAELFQTLGLAARAGEILGQQGAVDLEHAVPLRSLRVGLFAERAGEWTMPACGATSTSASSARARAAA